MESITKTHGTYAVLGFGSAVRQQLHLLWLSRRPLLLVVAGLAIMALAGEPWNDGPMARFFAPWPVWAVFVGPLWAFTVWHNEGPSNRLYMWSQPVPRLAHSLARVLAGLLWLWIGYAAIALVGVVFAAFDGNAGQFAQFPAYGWVGYLVGPTIGYLIISVLTIPSDYPVRWFLAILFLVPITISLLVEWAGLEDSIQWLFTPLTDQEWGLAITMVGGIGRAIAELDGAVRQAAGNEIPGQLSTWWLAAAGWTLLWAAVVTGIASRHPDVLPRWNRKK